MAVAQAPTPLTGAQLAALSPQARAQYFAQLPPAQQAAAQQAYQQAIVQINRNYLKNTVTKKAVCPPASGSGTQQNFALGQTLPFNVPTAENAFLEGFFVRITGNFDFAAGASAVYAATKSRELALIDNITVLYNGTQAKLRPYHLNILQRLTGSMQPGWPNSVVAGSSNAVTNTYLSQGALPVTGANQAVTLEFYVPLNALHIQDVRGLLPIDGSSTTCQINIQCAAQLLGNDPVLNTWYAVSGTGHAITFNGGVAPVVQLIAKYRDGTSYTGVNALPINLGGMGTVQYFIDVPLTPLTAGNILRQKITILDQIYYAISVLIDGQQATDYALDANIQVLEFGRDSTGFNIFWKYGTGTNMSVQEYFDDLRFWTMEQDLPQGVVPWVYAPVYNEPDPSNMNGTHVLNTDPNKSGWTDIHYGMQVGSLAATLSGVTPRIETFLVYVNSAGLIAGS